MLGRWIRRDPFKERGGKNLYCFCRNNCIVGIDLLGCWALTLISDFTTEDDLSCWLAYDKESFIASNIHNSEELLQEMEKQVDAHGGAKITKLNLSGHGIGNGSGISFSNGTTFDLLRLSSEQLTRLKQVISVDATIHLWSCDSAKTKIQCEGLKKVADKLSVCIIAKNSEVGSGPDVGGEINDFIAHVVAYLMKSEESSRWIVIKPVPSLNAPVKDGPEVKVLTKRRIR